MDFHYTWWKGGSWAEEESGCAHIQVKGQIQDFYSNISLCRQRYYHNDLF